MQALGAYAVESAILAIESANWIAWSRKSLRTCAPAHAAAILDRDINAGNIFLCKNGLVKILDLARRGMENPRE